MLVKILTDCKGCVRITNFNIYWTKLLLICQTATTSGQDLEWSVWLEKTEISPQEYTVHSPSVQGI